MAGMTAAQKQWRAALRPPKKTTARTELDRAQAAAEREKHERALRLKLISSPLTRHCFTTQYPIQWHTLSGYGKFTSAQIDTGYFDFAIWFSDPRTRREVKLAVEVEGGIWLKDGGRHNRPQGYIRDTIKYNQAIKQGWDLLRYPPDTLDSALDDIEQIIMSRLDSGITTEGE